MIIYCVNDVEFQLNLVKILLFVYILSTYVTTYFTELSLLWSENSTFHRACIR
jgi:hypothetical protein